MHLNGYAVCAQVLSASQEWEPKEHKTTIAVSAGNKVRYMSVSIFYVCNSILMDYTGVKVCQHSP